MSSQSASEDSSQNPYHLFSASGVPSSDGGSHTPVPVSRPSPILNPSIDLHTHFKVVVVDPLEATIARKPIDSTPQDIFFNHALSDPHLVDISSATEDDKVMSPLGPVPKVEGEVSCVYASDQSFFDNYDEDNDVEITLRVPYCENMNSSMNEKRLEKLLESCNPVFLLVVPMAGERCHCFDCLEVALPILSAIISTSFFKLGFSLPMHPFFLELLDFYNLAPMQLTPSFFIIVACMIVLYH